MGSVSIIRRSPVLRPLLLVLLAGASFAAVCALQRPFAPWPKGLGLRVKMEYVEEALDEYDALYIGSSRVVRGIDPAIIDARLTEAGRPQRSFNLAVGGCLTFEQDYLLREILALRPARLRTIYIEGGPVGMGLRDDHVFRNPPNLWTERGVGWHTPGATRRLLESLSALPLPAGTKLGMAWTHLQLLGWNLTNYGRGAEVVEVLLASKAQAAKRGESREAVHIGQGYQSLEEATGREVSDEVLAFREDPAPFLERMARIPEENALPVPPTEVNAEFYREQLRAAREAGIRLVYFVPPGLEGSPERLRMHEAGVLPELLFFNDPARFPELFQLDYRFDKGHLNRAGAELLSEAFAEAVLELGDAP